MKSNPKKKFCGGDLAVFIIISAILALSLTPRLFDVGEAQGFSISTEHGTEHYLLGEDREITVVSCGITLTAKVENGEVSVTKSSCPDGVCVASSPISRSGSIVCLPAKTVIKIDNDGRAESEDFIVG